MTGFKDNRSDKYELVVGLEVHVQLSTKSKIFSSDSALFGAGPNQQTSPVSLGLPGTLPKLNREVVLYAVKLGLATKCNINLNNHFDRKNYFYADLPKGYQITQDQSPICQSGYISVCTNKSEERKIRINRIHMEEDAGKSMHDKVNPFSLIDLNRAGVPLLEIVSEPDIRSAEEAAAYLTEIRKIVRYLDICDGNMEEGSLRCDANISIRLRGEKEFGNRCEVKNLNSIRNLQRAINYEFARQAKTVEAGGHISQNTLNFDAATGETSVLRSKEMANDYRYFPEPDLQPLHLSREWVEDILKNLPELPEQRSNRYAKDYSLSAYDAALLTSEKATADFFERVIEYTSNYKSAANWVIGPVQSFLNVDEQEASITDKIAKSVAEIISLIDSGKINYSSASQQLFPAMLRNPERTAAEHMLQLNLSMDTDTAELCRYIEVALAQYPEKVIEFNSGKKGVLGLFMGEVMRLSKGKIDPKTANKLVIEKLESLK